MPLTETTPAGECIVSEANKTRSREPITLAAGAAYAACAVLDERARGVRTVGFLGTTGMVKSGIYQQRIEARGYACLAPAADDQEELVMGGIYRIKAGDLAAARRLLERAADGLRARGAGAIVLGCTEIPIVVEDGGDVVDATRALAGACVRRFTVADAAA